MLKRWKQGIRRFTSVLLTASVTLTTVGAFPAQTFAAAGQETYVSEVMAYQGSLEDAKANYPDYIFVEEDICQDGGSGISTYLGYKTTDDVTLAIRDIATLQMNGNYKIGDYQTLMEEQREGIKALVYEMQTAANEYRENYQAGKQRALNACELLNKYYEEDTGLKMGDFFLADNSQVSYDNYETLLMQSNSTILNTIKKILLTASDTKEETWVDRMAATKDFDGLLEKENENRKANGEAALSQKAARAYYAGLFQDMIKYFEEGWELLRTGLNKYLETGISIGDGDASDQYMEELNEEGSDYTAEEYATYGAICEILEQLPYEEGTMLDFFLQPFAEADELQMYVLMDSMSEAQCELGVDLGLAQLFLSTAQQSAEKENKESLLALPEETRDSDEAQLEEMHEAIVQNVEDMIDSIEIMAEQEVVKEDTIEDGAVSVYAGIDRDYFKGSFGMTSDGQKQQLTSDTPWYKSTEIVVSSYVSAVIGVSLTAVGICKLVQSARISSQLGEYTERIALAELKLVNPGAAQSFHAAQIEQATNLLEYYKNFQAQSGHGEQTREGMVKFLEEQIEDLNRNKPAEPDLGALQQAVDDLKMEKQGVESQARFAKILGTAFLVAGIALTAYSLTVNIMRLLNQEDPSYTEIPEKMVDTSKTEEATQPYLYYKVVRNQNGKAADLNSYTSGTWLALYTTNAYDAGLPIQAKDFGMIRRGEIGSDTLNKGFVHEFGAVDPGNLLGYSKNAQDAEAAYLFYNHGEEDLSGSVFGRNAKTAVLILAGMAIVAGAAAVVFRRKKAKNA